MNAETSSTLAAIRPTVYQEVMDIVSASGIDVSPWSIKQDGSAVARPRGNPSYVYEWAFGGDSEPTLLCIWHRSLEITDDRIVLNDSVRSHALSLDLVATDQTAPAKVKSRARSQAKRARKFDSLVQRAFRTKRSVRVVLVEGKHNDEADLGWGTSEVETRLLDPLLWYVHAYGDADGQFHLVRNVPPSVEERSIEADADQTYDALFDLDAPPQGNETPERVVGKISGFKRDDEVREFVRKRSKGFCEYCDAPGFLLPNGRKYIETHHLLWLADGGSDTPQNVIALCANHHREVHYGQHRKDLELKMQDKLKFANT